MPLENEKTQKRREDHDRKQAEWAKKKVTLLQQIKFQSDGMDEYLGKIERGLDVTGDLQYHLDKMKEMFEEIRDTDHDLKTEAEDIEQEAEDLREDAGTKSVAGAVREAARRVAGEPGELRAFTQFRFPSRTLADSAWLLLKKQIDWGKNFSLGRESEGNTLGVPKVHEAEVSDVLDRAKIPYSVEEGVGRRAGTLPVIQGTRTRQEKYDTCPHCAAEIGEKELFFDQDGVRGAKATWYHRNCKGAISFPGEDFYGLRNGKAFDFWRNEP